MLPPPQEVFALGTVRPKGVLYLFSRYINLFSKGGSQLTWWWYDDSPALLLCSKNDSSLAPLMFNENRTQPITRSRRLGSFTKAFELHPYFLVRCHAVQMIVSSCEKLFCRSLVPFDPTPCLDSQRYLANNTLTTLPEGIFEDLTALTML